MTQQPQADSPNSLSHWTNNGPVRIHYLDSNPNASSEIPIVFVPGFGEEATEYLGFIEALRPRRTLVVDLRGRGRSDVPETGYTIDDHASDLDAVVRGMGVKQIHLVSFSRGTCYSMRWATLNPGYLKSYTIGDYPAEQIVPPAWFHVKSETSNWRGRPVNERMPVRAIRRMFADAVNVSMWDDLKRLRCPIQVIRGGAEGGMVDAARVARYREAVADLHVETFEESGHDLWLPDPLRFPRRVAAFVADAEARSRS
jgi:pimeloyl-ACP methyl ester carboxylesterase